MGDSKGPSSTLKGECKELVYRITTSMEQARGCDSPGLADTDALHFGN